MWTLAAALLATLSAAAPAAPAAPPVAAERDWGAPPPNASAEDGRLWRDLKEGIASAIIQLDRVNRSAFAIRYGRYDEALEERGADERARGARAELAAAVSAVKAAVPPKPGVHACRRVHLDLDQRLELPGAFADGARVRREARDCAGRMARLAAALAPATDRLEAALAAADALLGRPRPAAGERAAPDDAGTALEGRVR